MATLTMNKLWSFIESLSLSQKDRDWLIDKLQKPSFHVDPYEISPSGDTFFADARNVEAVKKDIAEAHRPGAKFTRLESKEDVMELIIALTYGLRCYPFGGCKDGTCGYQEKWR